MKKHLTILHGLVVQVHAYYTMTTYAPSSPDIHASPINARNKTFVIGATSPSTHCGLADVSQCPAGDVTLINEEMTLLAAEVPGGQFIYVAPDGSISYPSAHSSFRPPGSQVGGFYQIQVMSDYSTPVTVLAWQSKGQDGSGGLWACPTSPGVPVSQKAVLKASMLGFVSVGCVLVDAVQIHPAGNEFGAWAYT
ncbi:Fc.00g114680.m01.CDS01 [Cosmosporella sp. VM-42]